MPTLAQFCTDFATERPAGTVLDGDTVLAQGVAATRFYAGYAGIAALAEQAIAITGSTELDWSEWAVIRPLFILFVERENALHLEASRALGLDVFGRSVSEIAVDIAQYEQELPHLAFSSAIISI